ncbi:MAG: hypothetical protein P4L46_24075 [Fimbriimonas sp.]|nr:hypothetical protein [Fimbriimonas sp.]
MSIQNEDLDTKAQKGLEALRRAVAKAIERRDRIHAQTQTNQPQNGSQSVDDCLQP